MPLQVISLNLSREIAVASPKRARVLNGHKRSAVILGGAKNPRISSSALSTSSQIKLSFASILGLLLLLPLNGCHSASVNATVSNRTTTPISVVQVEYPSASFGIQSIAPGTDFHYRFKVLGTGPMKITYTDIAQHEQKSTGPTLTEGAEGALTVTVAPDGVHWQAPSPVK